MSSGAISFENESSIEERKRARQEEWERVRKESDPIQAPEQEICNKTLFEQLQENKDKRDSEYEESRKFKNHFRGLEEDETTFLAEVEVQSRVHRSDLDSELKSLIEENRNIVLENLTEPTPRRVESFSASKPVVKKCSDRKIVKSGLTGLVKKREAKSNSNIEQKRAKIPKIEVSSTTSSDDSNLALEVSLSSESETFETEILKNGKLGLDQNKTETSDVNSIISTVKPDLADVKFSALNSIAAYNDSDSEISDSD